MKPFNWILLSLPFYLLVRGRLFDYFALMGKSAPTQEPTE